jgi:hypothetical protein
MQGICGEQIVGTHDYGKSFTTEDTESTEGLVSNSASVSRNMFLFNCTPVEFV